MGRWLTDAWSGRRSPSRSLPLKRGDVSGSRLGRRMTEPQSMGSRRPAKRDGRCLSGLIPRRFGSNTGGLGRRLHPEPCYSAAQRSAA